MVPHPALGDAKYNCNFARGKKVVIVVVRWARTRVLQVPVVLRHAWTLSTSRLPKGHWRVRVEPYRWRSNNMLLFMWLEGKKILKQGASVESNFRLFKPPIDSGQSATKLLP
jgi:hypothetical protein